MLSKKEIICPESLLKIAKTKGPAKAVIVNAVKPVSIESAKQAVDANLILPVFIGDKSIIEENAKQLNWDISKYEIINEPDENSTAPIAAKLASEGNVKIIVKGHIHTDVLMKAVLKRDLNLIGKKRLSHIWHMTLEKNDKPFIITDGALNVLPKLETKMHILKNSIDIAKRIGIGKPKGKIEIADYEMIQNAWQDELNPLNISQGAYVSAQQYGESITHRLKLSAQSEENTIWPPRQLDNTGAMIGEPNSNLAPRGEVVSWTKLSAAGAPSEFSIRSPILGGITTALIEFSEGPKGVFLLADDEVNEPKIGDFVNLVVRRIYAQEGIMRYGTKAILQD